MTAFHEYASAAPRSSATWHNVRWRKLSVACSRKRDYSTLRAELMGLSSFQKPQKPPRYITSPHFVCSRSTFFYLWEGVQIFHRESIFCTKICSGGLYILKSSGGTNFGGSIFTVTTSFSGVLPTVIIPVAFKFCAHR